MAKCISKRLTSEIIDHNMQEGEPFRFDLVQTYALYVTQLADGEDLCFCLQRIVLCQIDCGDTEFKISFPEGCCLTILPPGTYEITLAEQYVHTVQDGDLGIDILLEPVDAPFVQSIIANGHSQEINMNCKTGLTQYLVETIISAKILEMLNNGTLQAGLKACDTACDTYLGKGTEIVTCNSFSDILCQAIEDGNTCLPFIDSFLLTGTVLTITAGDQTFPVDLAPLFAGFTGVKVSGFTFTSPSSNVIRLTQTDGSAFDVDLNYLVTDASDIVNIVTNDVTVRNTIAALFKQCSGVDHVPGNLIPTCQEMVVAINTAIATAIGGIAADKFLSVASYDSDTNELTLQVTGGSAFVIPLTDLVDSVFISTDALNQIVNGTDGGIYVAPVPASSDTVAGITEYATDVETAAGTSTTLAVTPAGLAAALAARPVSADVSKLFALNVGQTTTPSGSVPRTTMDIIASLSVLDPEFMTINAASNTVTFAAHTKSIIVELTSNAAFVRRTGGTDIDAGLCLKSTVLGTEVAFIYCQGRNAGEDNVQASGTALFELLPGDTDRTFRLTAVTQASGTWRVVGPFSSNPGITIKITKL